MTKRRQFITWHFYVPWYAFATVAMIWLLSVGAGGLLDGDLRCLWTLPFTTFPLFQRWMRDVWLWPREVRVSDGAS